MASDLTVRHLDADRFVIDVRGHTIAIDQPTGAGGADTAPTPTELFVAGLAGCVAFYAGVYLTRNGLPRSGLSVTAGFDLGGTPPRVTSVRIRLVPPPDLPAAQYEALRAVAAECTVHNSLLQPTMVDIGVQEPRESTTGTD